MEKRTSFRFLTAMAAGALVSISAVAQQTTVKGQVVDASGLPISYATVTVKGTRTSVNTDDNGNFSVKVAPGAMLRISYIGYVSQEVKATNNMTIILAETNALDEAVVIGYAKVKKSDATGSLTAIKPDEMTKGVTTNAQDMLVGKVAGVTVTSGGGTPGGGSTIRIRGGSSLNASNDPLIVIDGLAMDNNRVQGLANPLSMVNPEDIESFTVLKDASATAIYGSRASNGVIIITTKKGRKNTAPKVTYSGYVSFGTPRKKYDVLSGDEFRAYVNSFGTPPAALGTENTDWQDLIYRTAVSTDHNVNISGGIGNLPYRLSFGYTNQNGILKTSNFQRYTAAINLSPSFFEDHLQVNFNAKYMHAKNRFAEGGAVGSALAQDPTRPIYDTKYETTGGYWQNLNNSTDKELATWRNGVTNSNSPQNPLAQLDLKDDHSNANSFIGNVDVDYKLHFFPDVRIHASLGGDYSEGLQETLVSPYSFSNNYYGWNGISRSYKYNLQGNIYAQYMKTFGVHTLDVMAGAEQQHFRRTTFSEGAGTNWSNGYILGENGDLVGQGTAAEYTPAYRANTKHIYRNSLVSYFGRVNYTLMDRYLFTATVRADGSSRFAEGHKWGTFPSFAFAWKIKEEDFLKNVAWLSDLKLRLGWGITGQQNIGNDFYYVTRYVTGNTYAQYPFGDTYYTIARPEVTNKNLTWEKTTTWNAGLDFSFLNGRIDGTIDYYLRNTKDLISAVTRPAGVDFNNFKIMNVGSLRNTGVEFTVNARPIVSDDFTWQITYNVGWNKNKITALNTGAGAILTGGGTSRGGQVQAHIVGEAANSFYVFQQVYDEKGQPIEGVFVDRNADGKITDDDRYVYKKPDADVTMGMTNKFLYKAWDFSFTLRSSLNNYVYYDFLANNAAASFYSNSAYRNTTAEALAVGFTGKSDIVHRSDYFVRNASFLRCDNITLGYSFRNLFKGGKYEGIAGRVYATVQNPFVVTKYKGLDPELTAGNGVDRDIYPRPTTFLLGVNLQF